MGYDFSMMGGRYFYGKIPDSLDIPLKLAFPTMYIFSKRKMRPYLVSKKFPIVPVISNLWTHAWSIKYS